MAGSMSLNKAICQKCGKELYSLEVYWNLLDGEQGRHVVNVLKKGRKKYNQTWCGPVIPSEVWRSSARRTHA